MQMPSESRLHKGASIYDVCTGGGSPKNRQKEQKQLISYSDRGEGGQKILKFCGRHIWKPPNQKQALQRAGQCIFATQTMPA